jgi:hypothetical protein
MIGVKVRRLREMDARIARIPAFRPGPVRTLYSTSNSDANRLLAAARGRIRVDAAESANIAENAVHGAGFGTPETNKKVETAAIRHVSRSLESLEWSVKDVSRENRGYDLFCKRRGRELHVEVKGSSGTDQCFIITDKESRTWAKDTKFALVFVGNALSSNPSMSTFHGPKSRLEFEFRPVCFTAKRRI